MTKEIRLRMSEKTARNIIQPPEEREQLIRDGYQWNENARVAELHRIAFKIKWEFDIDGTQTDAVRRMELMED